MSSPVPSDGKLRERTLLALGILNARHLPGKHNQQDHADGGLPGVTNVLDKLKLAERIRLGAGEKLVSSRELRPSRGSDLALLQAIVATPSGREMRLGLLPHEDRRKWVAGNRGGTVRLDEQGVRDLGAKLRKMQQTGGEFSRRVSEMEKRPEAEQDWSWLGDEISVEEIPGNGWAGLHMSVAGTGGDEDADWVAHIVPRPADAGPDWDPYNEPGASFTPADLDALLKALLEGDSSAARAQALRDAVAREVQALLRGDDVDDDPIGELDDDTVILIMALDELTQRRAEVEGRAWNPALHKRWPKGHPKAGKFRPMVDLLKMAIAKHDGVGHPFDHFNREQLRKAAKIRGITLKRGEDKDSIAAKLLKDLKGGEDQGANKPAADDEAAKPAKKAVKKAAPAAPEKESGTLTLLGTKFTPAMQKALVDVEDSGGMQKQSADFQLEYDLSDNEMSRLVDDGFIEADDSAGGGGFIGVTPRGEKAIAELSNPAKKPAPAKKATPVKAAAPAKKAAAPAKKAATPVKATPEALAVKPKAGSKVQGILTGDFSKLKKVGEGAGTTPAGIYEAPDGSRWYVKAQQSAAHANNEALASALYRAAGIDVPAVVRGKGAPGLSGENHTATRMVDGAKTNLKDKLGADDAYIDKIREGFAVDAWLANWDVVGEGSENPWANIVEGADGRPHRIDVGGAILFRGQGGEKGDKFGPQVIEFNTMRTPNKGRRHPLVFADITDKQLSDSVGRVEAIDPKKIRQLVKEHGMDSKVADLLIARREDLLSRAATKIIPKDWNNAATGGDALDAAPATIRGWHEPGALADLEKIGVDSDVAQQAMRAFADYQDGQYGTYNKALLKAAGGPIDVKDSGVSGKAAILAMDKVMQQSKLTQDVIVYRGERAPARNFPPGVWSMTGGMEGLEWTFHSFGSSSADMEIAETFATGPTSASPDQAQPTVMRILARKGTPAVNLKGTMEGEQELLLARSLKYRVVKDYGVEDGIVRRIDVEVVPA